MSKKQDQDQPRAREAQPMNENEEYAMRLDDEAARQSHIFGQGTNLLAAALQAGAKALRQVSAALAPPAPEAAREELSTQDYRNAPGGDGPQAGEWADKPHRLIYDLCGEIERLRATREGWQPTTADEIAFGDGWDAAMESTHSSGIGLGEALEKWRSIAPPTEDAK